MKFSEKLQTLRKEKKMSQEDLAQELDVSRQSVSKWESGTTYPEMDKLLALCKIFNCSLEDLTNDNISKINVLSDEKILPNLVNNVKTEVKRIYEVFAKMDFKDFIKFLIYMGFMLILISLLFIPFDGFRRLMNNIYRNFGAAYGLLSSITNLIICVIYSFIAVVVLYYAFKLKYLDNEVNENNIIKEERVTNMEVSEKEEVSSLDGEKIKNNLTIIKTNNRSVLDIMVNAIIIFVKGVVAFCSLPFILTLICLSGALMLIIFLIFKGIVSIGLIICIISLILLNILLLYLAYYFIVGKKIKIKAVFITFIVGLVILGGSCGIMIGELSKYEILDELPEYSLMTSKNYEYNMQEDFFLDTRMYGYYYSNIKYKVDNALGSKVLIDLEYYDKYVNYEIEENKPYLYVNLVDSNYTKLFDEVLTNLENKKIYNYDKYIRYNITITASEENIIKMKENEKLYYDKIHQEDYYNMREELKEKYWEQYQIKLEEYQEQIENLEEEISILKEQVKYE